MTPDFPQPEDPTVSSASPGVPDGQDRGGYRPIPGPVNRVSFFEEQARNRRAAWRIAAACMLVVLVMGIVTSVDLAPIFLAVLVVVADLANLAIPMPDFLAITAHWLHVIVHSPAFNGPNVIWRQAPYGLMALTAVIASIPGVLLLAGIAQAQRSMFARAGVGGTLLALGARDPKPGDLEEHQLVNIVGEMAIAANLPPPKVLLLDDDECNAAVVGSSPTDATVVVTRRLLDDLDRDETQGVLGHLIGSIGNGDLKIAFDILAVFTTYGTLMALLDAPFGPMARGLLGRMAHMRSAKGNESAELDSMMRLLAKETRDSDDVSQATRTRTGGCIYWLLQPLVWANLMVKFMMFAGVCLILAPLISWLWRTRRYLADATAVQLTRNPDGLANALQKLSMIGGVPAGGAWASHLFIVGGEGRGRWRGPTPPPAEVQRIRSEVLQRMQQARAQGETPQQMRATMMEIAEKEHVTEYLKDASGAASSSAGNEDSSSLESIVGGGRFHPAVEKRMRRLQAQGSSVAAPETKHRWGPAGVIFVSILCLILAPLIVALVVLIPMVGAMLAMLAMIIDLIWFAVLIVPLDHLLRHLHH